MNIMQEINILKLHAAFPKLDVDTVNDVLKECGGDASEAEAKIRAVFGNSCSSAVVTPVQSPTRGAGVPWSPVPGQRLVNNASEDTNNFNSVFKTPTASRPVAQVNNITDSITGRAVLSPTRIVTPLPKGNCSPNKPETPSSLTPSVLDSLMPPAPQTAPAPTPERAFKLPLPLPLPLEPEAPKLQPAAPVNNPMTLPPHLQHLLSPPPAAVRTQPPAKFEPGGWEEEPEALGTPKQAAQPPQATLANSTAAPKPASPDEESKLDFLQGMFAGMDAALVADVLQGVNDNAEAAIEKLMALQDVVDHTEMLDSSSGSEDGRSSQSLLAVKPDSASANCGQPWDVSGEPVDYTFKGLSDEQKVVLIRRELPRCSAEEAMNSLEACGGDVDAALAMMAQAFERMPPGKEASTPDAGSSGASPEVLELKELFPDVDSATLGNVYNAAGKNVDITKKMLEESGLVPFEAVPGSKKATGALFSQPAAAEVFAPVQQPLMRSNGRPHAIVRRSDAHNQRLYDEHRAQARALKKVMEDKFAEAHRAFARGETILGRQLIERGHQARADYLAARPGDNIFKEKNKHIQNMHVVDLHGLHVHEAIEKTDNLVRLLRGFPSSMKLNVITGKGLHSQGNIARLLPAIEEYLKENDLHYCVHQSGGCLIVDIPNNDEPPDIDRYAYDRIDMYEHG